MGENTMSHPASFRATAIRCVVFDVDGVLTDGRIILGSEGEELKAFDVRDGLRMVLARRSGLKTAIITGRSSGAVARRARELGVDHLFQGADDKVAAGLAAAVADAAPEVRGAADWVAQRPGGRGAAGEFVEFLLRSQGRWEDIAGAYGG
jgi:3-deoxy-D-manno-octulosonate 8-phosphate phosphatase (KDO 8-P phosphatase)